MINAKMSVLEISDAEACEVTDPVASVTRLAESYSGCRDALCAGHDSNDVDAAHR